MSAILEVKTTFATHADAEKVARLLVSERLAACAQIIPGITSIYEWEDMLRHDDEVLLMLKTTEETWPRLRDRVAEIHPYDTPELVAVPLPLVSFDYATWVREQCREP
jgi:uncharacterized protein involved in tolerance to divalent cations